MFIKQFSTHSLLASTDKIASWEQQTPAIIEVTCVERLREIFEIAQPQHEVIFRGKKYRASDIVERPFVFFSFFHKD